ncbi:tRNA (cytidine(34)-2'-O)-methyltransferase [Chitinimonas sp. BJB300]|uniref:tRNA (cytidine(34)-2'-O)-methyltransferase n=1 Tax=Chitinimonas sp. BJB300 TaxID=1559339 RepID=UPI000C10C87D|nr:tRNA (cytidine(34)-2'-O)-methyltransferase [Chitinimonas sp. BJB300]PHV11738.1 tRNA (uridine(34)/cytosine(34)/5-carboxymethylaminomethyluridine(34)-2'-O)-methyltransferase TrmL [Chitinimonas sp. BJB300]TSJ90015.1 tRNA (cytidine(34)-2'-O)-methyltransferase [Chitinimonas sp. BJB300]
MFAVILFQPEIPPNTGNIIRLCANTGCELHLVKPLGFPLEDAKLRRAGLDYHEYANMQVHENWEACAAALAGRRIFALTTRGARRYDQVAYQPGDVFLFGRESAGLPDELRNGLAPEQRIKLPMRPDNRSLNLSNAVAVTVFEAWRQHDFAGGLI